MEYKILITLFVENISPLKALIGQTDVIRGEPCSISINIKNIGETSFPGGKINGLRIDYSPVGTAFSAWKEEWTCPLLMPQQELRIMTVPLVPLTDGLAWMRLNITSQDGQPIMCFQQVNEPLQNPNAWISCIYVINRELVQIINLLSKKGG